MNICYIYLKNKDMFLLVLYQKINLKKWILVELIIAFFKFIHETNCL